MCAKLQRTQFNLIQSKALVTVALSSHISGLHAYKIPAYILSLLKSHFPLNMPFTKLYNIWHIDMLHKSTKPLRGCRVLMNSCVRNCIYSECYTRLTVHIWKQTIEYIPTAPMQNLGFVRNRHLHQQFKTKKAFSDNACIVRNIFLDILFH